MTVNDVLAKVTKEYKKWVGYTEKSSMAGVTGKTYDNPGNYNAYAGYNNYTIFAVVYKAATGINVQGQPWCDCFVDTILIHLFGVDIAKKLLGGFSAYTPTSSNYFKKMNRWYTSNPQEGDIIFFKNSTRIHHTGYVYKVTANYVLTVEGNTSSGDNQVDPNGGCVAMKKYLKNNTAIAGYGRPDYSLCIEPETKTYYEGWCKAADNKRWWYQFKDGSYALNDGKNNGWYKFDGYWYVFDEKGYMLTGAYTDKKNHLYYLCETVGPDEGKCMTSYGNQDGYLTPWKS